VTASDQQFLAAMMRLVVNDGTVVVTTALERAAVRTILLKGPALAERLYGAQESRPYTDTDLLVSVGDLARAGATLRTLGYGIVASHEVGGVPVGHAQMWSCGRHVVDLHVRLPGATTAGAELWAVLSARTRPTAVRGHRLLTLDDGAAAMLLALHVAHHGPTEFGQACEDLRRGLERFGPSTWVDAAELARLLGAEGAMGWGLRLVPGGNELAVRLSLPATPTPTQFVLAGGRRPHVTAGLEEIASASSWSAVARIVLGKLFPSALVLRAYGAGPTRRSMVAAWLRRARLLARHAPAGTRDFLLVTISRRRQRHPL
jgi:putative nucleotidyltransferase-like protein